jgi:nicotinamide riboside transporter PnuC
MLEFVGLIATALAVWGVVLNNRRRRTCFLIWMVSNTMTLIIHAYAGIWSLALRDLIFLGLAVEGYYLWKE